MKFSFFRQADTTNVPRFELDGPWSSDFTESRIRSRRIIGDARFTSIFDGSFDFSSPATFDDSQVNTFTLNRNSESWFTIDQMRMSINDIRTSEDIFVGDDKLIGSLEDDVLYGYGGNDRIFGGAGDDVLNGGTGKNRLIGGSGSDTFELSKGEGVSKIRDFNVYDDTIKIMTGSDGIGLSTKGTTTLIYQDGDLLAKVKNIVVPLSYSDFIFETGVTA